MNQPDFLDQMVEESIRKNPEFSKIYQRATQQRKREESRKETKKTMPIKTATRVILGLAILLLSGCCCHSEKTTFKNHQTLVRGRDGFITYCTRCDKIWRAEYNCSCDPPEKTMTSNTFSGGLPWGN